VSSESGLRSTIHFLKRILEQPIRWFEMLFPRRPDVLEAYNTVQASQASVKAAQAQMQRSRINCRPMFGTTQRRNVTTRGRFRSDVDQYEPSLSGSDDMQDLRLQIKAAMKLSRVSCSVPF
jgi:outer membrane protein TolC